MAYAPDELTRFAYMLQSINALAAQIPCDALTELVQAVNAPIDFGKIDNPIEAMEQRLNVQSWRDTMRAFPSYRLEMERAFERSRAYQRRASKAGQN